MNRPIKSRVEFGEITVEITAPMDTPLCKLCEVLQMALGGLGYNSDMVEKYIGYAPPELNTEAVRHG